MYNNAVNLNICCGIIDERMLLDEIIDISTNGDNQYFGKNTIFLNTLKEHVIILTKRP